MHGRLISSDWNDIKSTSFNVPGTKSLFSTRDSEHGRNLFFISKKEFTPCDEKEGWLRVLEDKCPNFPVKKTSGIYYSKKKTAALWTKGTNGPLKRQKNWAWTCGKGCTDRIILPVYRDNNFLRVEKKVGQGPSCARLR